MRTITIAALAAILLAGTAHAAPMSSYTTKSSPVGADSVLINDSEAANATKKATLSSIVALSPSMTYPGPGVPLSTGSAWGTSYTVGTAANNLVQLNGSAQLPAVSADLLTITDTGTYFTTDTVGAALQELGSGLADVTEITLDASLTETGGVLSVTNPVTDYDTDGDGDFTDEAWFPVGTGYTNLTQYLTQTAWRLFYSDGSGDVKELALGDSGKVLQANGATAAPTWETPSGGTGGYLATPPTYSDEACTPGQYALSESYRWDCVATGNWNRTALTDWSNPTPVPPTLTSATVGSAGLYADLLFSEAVAVGSGGNGGWSMTCSVSGAVSMTYSGGTTTSTLSYSLSPSPILQGETCTVAYTQPSEGIEAVDDGADLATIPSAAVTNNSTETGGSAAVYHEDFEDNATCATLGITAGGSPSCQFSSSGLGMGGSYVARLNANETLTIPLPSAMSEAVILVRARWADSLESSEYHLAFRDTGNANIVQMVILPPPDGPKANDGTNTSGSVAGSYSAGNTYWMKLYYKAGSGANGIMSAAVWSGSAWVSASRTDSAKTADATSIQLRNWQDGADVEYWYYDDIYVFAEDVTGDPNAL